MEIIRKKYITPNADKHIIRSKTCILAGSPGVNNEIGDGEQLSKDTDWEDDDHDGGSPIW